MSQITCYKCGFSDNGKYCSKCSSLLEQPTGFMEHMKPIFGPLNDYFYYTANLLNSKKLAEDIKLGRLHSIDAIKLIISAVSISFLFTTIFPSQIIIPNIFPILSEVLEAILISLVVIITVSPIHYFLIKKGEKIPFSKYSIAVICITALFYPWLTLIGGLLEFITNKDPSKAVQAIGNLSLYFYGVTFSHLYKVTFSDVLAAFGKLILIMMPIGAAIGYFAASIN